jgi:uncharacterized protein (TIGR03437 family)
MEYRLSCRYLVAVANLSQISVIPEGTPGVAGQPAKAGDYLQFSATGFGPTAEAYPIGTLLPSPYVVENLAAITVKVGGTQAELVYACVILPGLYQLNIRVPNGVPPGYQSVVATVGGVSTQAEAVLPFL